jgi:hypothetical protein
MSEVNWDSLKDTLKEAATDHAKGLIDEWTPHLAALGEEALMEIIDLVMSGKEEEATEAVLQKMSPLALLESARGDVAAAIEDADQAMAFLTSLKDTVVSIGTAVAKATVIALI